jgi:hypothetical protein
MTEENKKEKNIVNEPSAHYNATTDNSKKIIFFKSFEEENEYTAKLRALLSYDERMIYAEQLRRIVFSQYLLPDGNWMPVAKVLSHKEPRT